MAMIPGPNLSATGTTAAGVTATNNLNQEHATGFPVINNPAHVHTVTDSGGGGGPVGYAS